MNSLTTMYLCDLVGMKKFSNATGIINLFRGFGCFLGPYIGGNFKTITFFFTQFLNLKKKGIVSQHYGKVMTLSAYSALCFIVGLVFTCLVSFGSLCKSKKEDEANETNESTAKTVGDSELNKNLLNSKE